jgi:plasmid stabilization system protein ParE
MKVSFALTAIWDLVGISQYITAKDPPRALRVEAAVRRAVTSLETMPMRGRKQRQRKLRKIGAGRYPYNIYYQIDLSQQTVIIVHIRHASRKQKYRNT